jgi:hypothetical protein
MTDLEQLSRDAAHRGMSELDHKIFPGVIHLQHCAVAFGKPCNCNLAQRRSDNLALVAMKGKQT